MTTFDEEQTQKAGNAKPEWAKLAGQALDLWQSHLTSLANDPKAKEEMARFVAPMSQMFEQWTGLMHQGLQGTTPHASTETTSESVPPQSAAADSGDVATAVSSEPVQPVSCGAGLAAEPEPLSEPTAFVAEGVGKESAAEPEPLSQPILPEVTGIVEESSDTTPAAARGRTAPADGPRDLAQLASRLAQLERELDQIRPRRKRIEAEPGGDADAAVERASSGDAQRMAGPGTGTATG